MFEAIQVEEELFEPPRVKLFQCLFEEVGVAGEAAKVDWDFWLITT